MSWRKKKIPVADWHESPAVCALCGKMVDTIKICVSSSCGLNVGPCCFVEGKEMCIKCVSKSKISGRLQK